MNLYDKIKPGKRRRGWGGAVFLAAACVVLVICIGTIGWAAEHGDVGLDGPFGGGRGDARLDQLARLEHGTGLSDGRMRHRGAAPMWPTAR